MKYKLAYIFLLSFLLAFVVKSHKATAQEVKVSAKLDTLVMPIGQQQSFHLQVIQPEGLNIQFPVYTDTIVDKVEILDYQIADTIVLDDRRIQINHDYTITCFDSGFYYIPPAKFLVKTEQGEGDLFSEPNYLKIQTFEIDTAQAIFDIKEPIELPYQFKEILPYLIGGFVAILLIAGIVLLIMYLTRKKKGEVLFEKQKPQEPPHVIALRELEKVKEEKLWQSNHVKEYYTRLTDVLRVYIEGRYRITAMEQTSFEIMEDMRRVERDSKAALDDLKMILSTADLVKFAKQKPLPNENDLCLVKARSFVEDTKKVEELVEDQKEESDEAKLNDKNTSENE